MPRRQGGALYLRTCAGKAGWVYGLPYAARVLQSENADAAECAAGLPGVPFEPAGDAGEWDLGVGRARDSRPDQSALPELHELPPESAWLQCEPGLVQMRFLLALLLMAPAFAQQPDLQAKTGDQAAQGPATPANKPADQPAAKPADTTQSPAPSGEQWFTGSVDFGYRWLSDIRGNDSEYRSVLNLGAGPKLTALDFTITDPKHRLFDRLDASAFGWGGDPYNTAHLDARKKGDYDFTFDYRNIAYFDAVPSYANPIAPGGFNEQSFDTHRRSMTVGLDLRPGKRIVPYLVFDRNSGYGNGVEEFVQDSNDEFPVATLLRDSTNNYRGGVRFEYNRFHITLEQGGTTYKDDDQANFNGTEFGDRTSLLLGETLQLNTLNQAYAIRGNSIYSKVLATAHPFSWMDLYGQFLYSEPKTTVHFTEAATGNFALISQLLFYSSQQTLGTGAANQPHTTGNVGFEIRPLKRMRIIESWMTDRYHDAAFGMLTSVSLPTNILSAAESRIGKE